MPADIKSAVRPLSASTLIDLLAGRRPRVLALGEPTHGEDVLLEVRNDLFQDLVEHEGYRTIAVESDCLMGLLVDDYVTLRRGDLDLDDVMQHGFSHGFGAAPGNRALVRWMRAYNEGRSEADRVRFLGFDGPLEMAAAASPRQALTALHAFITERAGAASVPWSIETIDALLGPDDRWTEPAAMMDPSRSIGRTPEADQLRLISDDLASALAMHAPHLVESSSPDEWDRAHLYARTARDLLRYHSWMADDSPARITQLLGIRASTMAGNLLAAARRGPVLVHAHNAHLQRDKSQMRMGGIPLDWWSAGAIAETELIGDSNHDRDYAFFATALGTIRHHGVETPPSNTVEGLLYALPEDRCAVDLHQLHRLLNDVDLVPRVSEWFGYAPLDPAHFGSYDGMVFIRDAPAQ